MAGCTPAPRRPSQSPARRHNIGHHRVEEASTIINAVGLTLSTRRRLLIQLRADCIPTALLSVLLHRTNSSQRHVGGGSHALAITKAGKSLSPSPPVAHTLLLSPHLRRAT